MGNENYVFSFWDSPPFITTSEEIYPSPSFAKNLPFLLIRVFLVGGVVSSPSLLTFLRERMYDVRRRLLSFFPSLFRRGISSPLP